MLLIGIIILAACISGIILLLIFLRLIDINSFFKTNTFKRRNEGFSDLLQYDTVIEDGIILLKNGSLLSGFYYQGLDMSEMAREDQDVLSARISKAIFELGTGWTVNFDAIRLESRNYPDRAFSSFEKEISFAIDEERRELFSARGTMFRTENLLTVTYTPPALVSNKIVDMMYTTDENGEQLSYYDKNLIHFKNKLNSFFAILSTIFKIERLGRTTYILEDGSKHTRDIFLEYLHYCATGKVQAINTPQNIDIKLDSLICGEDFITGIYPKIGKYYISAVAIDGFPAESYPTILNRLSDIPVTTRFSTRFICIDKFEAEKKLESIKKRWQQKQRGMMQVILNQQQTDTNTNWDAVEMTNDAMEGVTLQNSERAIFGYYTANIILMEEKQEDLEKWSLEIKKIISALGFNARIETINTVEAFLGSLPGHNIENVRRFFIHSLNLGDLIPKHTVWTGYENAPCDKFPAESPCLMECVTTGNTPYHLNLHVKDVGHTLIVGPTGAGKSTLLCMIAAQAFRYKGATVFSFDKGMSMFALNQALGGSHFEIGSEDSTISFAPFNYIDTQEEKTWLVSFVENILQLNKVVITPNITASIYEAINRLYEVKQAHSSDNKFHITITDFIAQLHNQGTDLQEIMNQYDTSGAYGSYFSSSKDNLDFQNFVTFELEKLMNLDDKILLPVLDYLFRKIDLRLKGQPAFLLIDEAWIAFKNPIFSKRIIEWLKVFRKRNCSVILATQNLADTATSETETLLSELIISTASKIFLPNPAAIKDEFKIIYKKFGLNEQQIKIIANAIPKRQYFHYTEEGSRLFELAIGELALKFVAVSTMPEINMIKGYINTYSDKWVYHYLSDKGINLNKYLTYFNSGAVKDGNI